MIIFSVMISLIFIKINITYIKFLIEIYYVGQVNNFQSMSLSQRTELKWKYLFTNCAMKLVISKTYPEEKPTILVVDIDNKGPIFQFITSIPIY